MSAQTLDRPVEVDPVVVSADLSSAEPPRRLGLAVHLGLQVVLVAALLASVNLSDSWAVDDGAYATQVKVIQQTGGWEYPYEFAPMDPERVHGPVSHSTLTLDGRLYPYTRLPAWIFVLKGSVALFGDPLGFYLPSVLGGLAAAATAWWLAGRFNRRLQPFAFWVVAAGPLLMHTSAMWAHTVGAALGGVAAVGVLDVARRRRPWVATGLITAALCALILLRNEGLLLSAATLVTLGVVGLMQGSGLAGRLGTAFARCAIPTVGVVVTVLASQRWAQRVAPGPYDANVIDVLHSVSWLEGRWMGAVRTFVDGAGASPQATTLALAGVGLFVGAGLLLRRGQVSPALWLTVTGLALVALRTLTVRSNDLAGLLVAAPLLLVAVLSIRWREVGLGGRVLAAWCALYGTAVVLTQYPEGGSRDWGGRYLFVVLVPLSVGAVAAALRLVDSSEAGPNRRALVGVLAAAVLVPSLLGVSATRDLRAEFGAMTEESLAPGSEVVIRTERAFTRAAWRVLPESYWLTARDSDVPEVLGDLEASGVATVTVSGPGAAENVAEGFEHEVLTERVVVYRLATP